MNLKFPSFLHSFILIFLFFLPFESEIIAQSCGSLDSKEAPVFFNPNRSSSDGCGDVLDYDDGDGCSGTVDLDESITLNMVFNFISYEDGSGKVLNYMELVSQVNAYFSPSDIQFNIIVNQLPCNACMDDIPGQYSNPQYVSPNCLNVMIYNEDEVDTGSSEGLAIIGGNVAYSPNNISFLIHEIGHLLGLRHTFKFNGGPFGDSGGDAEHVTRENLSDCDCNCTQAGDFVCDTPADPLAPGVNYVDSDCNWEDDDDVLGPCDLSFSGAFPDDYCLDELQGIPYPEILLPNAMNYYWQCKDNVPVEDAFTRGQEILMKKTIECKHQNKLSVPANFEAITTISGHTTLTGVVNVNTDIILDNGHLTLDGATLNMVPGTKIIVNENSFLEITNGSIIDVYDGPGCYSGLLWGGIMMNGTCEVEINDGTITNAEIAVTGSPDGGGKWISSDHGSECLFLNNKKTFEFVDCRQIPVFADVTIKIDNNIKTAPADCMIELRSDNGSLVGFQMHEFKFINETTYELTALKTMDATALVVGHYDASDPFQNEFTQLATAIDVTGGLGCKISGAKFENCDVQIVADGNNNFSMDRCNLQFPAWGSERPVSLSNCHIHRMSMNEFINNEDGNKRAVTITNNSEEYQNVRNNKFELSEYSIETFGDQGGMLQGLEFNCNEFLSSTQNGPPPAAILARGDIAPSQGTAAASAGNIFNSYPAQDVSYLGGSDVNYFYSGTLPTLAGSNITSTSTFNAAVCGTIGNIVSPPDDDDWYTEHEPHVAIDIVKTNISDIIDALDNLCGGSGYITTLIENLDEDTRNFVMQELLEASPYLSVKNVLQVFDKSHFFTEQEIVQVLSSNPELLNDNCIWNAVFESQNFSEGNTALLNQMKNVKSSRYDYNKALSYWEKQRQKVCNYAIDRIYAAPEIDYESIAYWSMQRNSFNADMYMLKHYALSDQLYLYTTLLDQIRGRYTCKDHEIEGTLTLIASLKNAEGPTSISKLNLAQINQLESLALGNWGYATTEATSILNYFYGYDLSNTIFEKPPHALWFKSSKNRDGNSAQNIIFYPNPSAGIFNLKISDDQKGGDLDIFDNLGKKVFTLTNLQSDQIIDLSSEAKGLYFYIIKNGENDFESGKLIKL